MKLDKLQGRTLAGRFRLDRLLGKGGYGAVFEAEQLSVGRRCAVKVLFAHLCDDEATVGRFRAEARTTSRLTHPNTIILYDFGRDDLEGLLFLAMELLDGRDLATVIHEQGLLSVDQAVHVAVQMAASLQEAHNLGLVHRDIKPRNVMLLDRGNDPMFVKVIDFGIAKVINSKLLTASDLTQTGTIIGTPKYMAPEQIRDAQIDGRTDMYALALTVYKVLTGRTPFEEGTALEIAGRQIAESPEPITAFDPRLKVSDEFEQVLLKALAKDPVDRFVSVADFARALVEATSGASAQMINAGMTPTSLPIPSLPTPSQPEPTQTLPDNTPSAVRRERRRSEQYASEQEPTALIGQEPDYPEVTYVPEAGDAPLGGRPATQAAGSGEAVTEDVRPATDHLANRTLATMAIPNAARPEAGEGTQRAGNTAEVESTAVLPNSSEVVEDTVSPIVALRMPEVSLSHLATISAALLVVLGGLAWYSTDSGGHADKLAAVGAVQDDGQALTTGVNSSADAAKAGELQKAALQEGKLQEHRGAAESAQPRVERPTEPTAAPGDRESGGSKGDDAEGDHSQIATAQAASVEPSVSVGEQAPKAPAKRRRRSVEVRVIPWGTLYINGRKVGEGTRHKLRLRQGRHDMLLKQDGAVRAERTVDVTGRSSKIIELVAK